MASLRRRLLLWSTYCAASLGCTEGSGPTLASVTTVTATSGPASDADGYTLQIDAERREPVGIADTLVVAGLAAGEHELELQGVAPNCTVSGGGTRTVTAGSDESAFVRFDVECSSTAGTLQVTTATGGVDLDPGGFVASVNDSEVFAIGANAVASTTLPTGSYRVALGGIGSNCTLDGPAEREAEVLSGGITRLEFALHCSATTPAGRGHEIAFLRSRREGFIRSANLELMNEDGTSVRPLPTISASSQRSPDWISDGDHLGFMAEADDCEFDCGKAYVLDLSTGTAEPVPQEVGFGTARWSPDGTRIVFEEASCETDCEPDPVTFHLVVAAADGSSREFIASDTLDYFRPAWLADGTGMVYVRHRDALLDIAQRNTDGSGEQEIGHNLQGELSFIDDLAPSPDGSRLAFTATPVGEDVPSQVYVVGMDGNGITALTGGPSNNEEPTWSPDSRRIAFASDRDGNKEIYVMDADGANQVRVTNDSADDTQPAWRP